MADLNPEISEIPGPEIKPIKRLFDHEAQKLLCVTTDRGLLHAIESPGNEQFDIATMKNEEEEDDLDMTVIDEQEENDGVNVDNLVSSSTQLVELGSSGSEHSLSLMARDNQLVCGQFVHLSDGSTAMVQRGYRVIHLSDGTSALLTSGLFSDSVVESSQLELDEMGVQIEEEDDEKSVIFEQHSSTGLQQQVVMDGRQMIIENTESSDEIGTELQSVDNGNGGDCLTDSLNRRITIGKAFKCSYEGCDRLYTTHHHLKVHMRSHTGDRPFRCDFDDCMKAFATGYGLKSHRRVHTGEKPYKCLSEICDKAFKTSGDLQKHMRTHTGERPFVCPYEDCSRSFTTSNIRKVHIRTHTGERPYTCIEKGCGKTFASATNYKNHIRIHSGEKPYECSVSGCGKRFTEYSSLYKHHVVHTHTKPYPCTTCGKTYRQTSTLAMHRRMAHGDELNEADGEYVGFIVEKGDETAIPKRYVFRMSEDGQRGNDDIDGNLVIDTSDAQQLTMTGASSSLLQQLPSTISIGNNTTSSHVLVVTDPSQIEAIQRISQQ